MTNHVNGRVGSGNGKVRPNGLDKPVPPIGFIVQRAAFAQKERIASQVRLEHLKLQGRTDEDTTRLLELVKPLEDFTSDRIRTLVLGHPTARWWRRITGANAITVGNIIGHIEAFGKWYPEGDPWIPDYVKREAVADVDGDKWVWVAGIERLATISKLWKYAGLTPTSGRTEGRLLDYNADLKVQCFRLMQFGFLMNADDCLYYTAYALYKRWKTEELLKAGVKILPTPRGRFCATCEAEKSVPRTTFFCPDCGTRLSKKQEPEGIKWLGHVDTMVRRHTVKLFLSHLWLIWRDALSLPIRRPWVVEKQLEHHFINPEEMCDLPAAEAAA